MQNTLNSSRPFSESLLSEKPLMAPGFSSSAPVLPPTQPCLIRAAEGRLLEMPGEKGNLKLPSVLTAGRVAAGSLEAAVNGGPPPHRHGNEDEIFLVQSGAFEIFVNGEAFECRAGDMAYLARNEAHCFRGLDSGEINSFNIVVAPGGFENFFARWVPMMQSGVPDPQEAAALCGEYGMALFASREESPRIQNSQSIIRRGAEVSVLNVLGDRVQILLTAAETEGLYSLVRVQGPRDSGPPLHIHENEDELFLIEKGSYEFTLGTRKVMAHAGDVVWAPRGHAHSFRHSSEGAQMAVFITPGGLDELFVECSAMEDPGAIEPAAVMELCARYQISLVSAVN